MELSLTSPVQNKLVRAAVLAPLVLVACGSEMIGEPLGQDGAHEHGIAAVGIIVDGQSATVDFRAPAADLWGFEHPPESQEEIQARDAALAALEAGIVEVIGFAPRLGCRMISTRWDGAAILTAAIGEHREAASSGDESHDHGHHEHSDDHHGAEDDHPDEGGHHDEEGAHHDEEDHHDHASSNVIAEFDIQCSEALAGSRLTLAVADLFESIEKVDLQAVSEASQFGRRVPARGSSIEL